MIDRRDWHGNIETIEIYASAIDKAKADMTGKWFGFKSRVIDVISDGDRALITIETCGRLPLVRKRWDKYLIPDQERKAIGVQALEYMMTQKAKETTKRGRPKKI